MRCAHSAALGLVLAARSRFLRRSMLTFACSNRLLATRLMAPAPLPRPVSPRGGIRAVTQVAWREEPLPPPGPGIFSLLRFAY